METKPQNVHAEASIMILWKWTGVSAVLHFLLIASLCGFSYWRFHTKEVASKAKIAAEEAAAKKAETEEAAKSAPTTSGTAASSPASSAPPAAAPGAPAEKPAVAPSPGPQTNSDRNQQAEKTLGIDKVAKPEDLPASPFSSKGDDILKDLK